MKKYLLVFTVLLSSPQVSFSQEYNGKLGYALSPAGHPNDFSQMGAFLQEVANTCNGGVVLANGNWRDNLTSGGLIPSLAKTICSLQPSPYNYIDMPVYAWATYPTQLFLNSPANPVNNWSNSNMKSLFLQMLIRTADSLQPEYLFLGNEVNFYIVMDTLDYANWAAFYGTAYDSVKAHSPSTKMGTVFNYEHLAGKGTNVGWTVPHWNALTDMDTSKMDVIGLTFYPFFEFQTANAVPPAHLDPLFSRIGNIPLVITETGWPGDSIVGNWSASPQQQVDFVNKIFSMLNGKKVEAVNWLFLNYFMDTTYLPEISSFKSIAMRDSSGNDRPALPVWLSYCNASDVTEYESNHHLKVYPVPCSNKLTIEISDEKVSNHDLIIVDMLGQIAFQKTLRSNQEMLNFNLADGLYFYQVKNRSHCIGSGKIIILQTSQPLRP